MYFHFAAPSPPSTNIRGVRILAPVRRIGVGSYTVVATGASPSHGSAPDIYHVLPGDAAAAAAALHAGWSPLSRADASYSEQMHLQ